MDPIPKIVQNPQIDLEKVREVIHSRIAKALEHTTTLERYEQLSEQGSKESGLLTEEIQRSSVIAHNLTEFQVLLEELSKVSNINTRNILAHENAHMNVAEAEKLKVAGYMITFLGKPDDDTISFAASVMMSPDYSSGDSDTHSELLKKVIRVLRAPEDYGETLSPNDKNSLIKARELLNQIEK